MTLLQQNWNHQIFPRIYYWVVYAHQRKVGGECECSIWCSHSDKLVSITLSETANNCRTKKKSNSFPPSYFNWPVMKDKPGTKKIEFKKLAAPSVLKPATTPSREARRSKKIKTKPIQTKSESFRSRSLRLVFALYFISNSF